MGSFFLSNSLVVISMVSFSSLTQLFWLFLSQKVLFLCCLGVKTHISLFLFVDDILILRVFYIVSLMVRFCGWLETAVSHLFVFLLLLSRCVNNNNN